MTAESLKYSESDSDDTLTERLVDWICTSTSSLESSNDVNDVVNMFGRRLIEETCIVTSVAAGRVESASRSITFDMFRGADSRLSELIF